MRSRAGGKCVMRETRGAFTKDARAFGSDRRRFAPLSARALRAGDKMRAEK